MDRSRGAREENPRQVGDAAFAFRALVLLAAAVGSSCGSLDRPDTEPPPLLGSRISAYGFTEIRPPSRLLGVGSVVYVISEEPLTVGLTCAPVESLGHDIASAVLESPSATSQAASAFEGTFALSADYQSMLSAVTTAARIERASLTLSRVRVQELSDTAIMGRYGTRVDACWSSLRKRKEQGRRVTLVKSALIADAVYTFSFEDSFSAEAKAQALRDISASLGFEVSNTGNMAVEGRNLIWGIRDDELFATLDPAEALAPAGSANDRRVLPAGAAVRVLPSDVVSHALSPIQQPSSMTCWAAAATMMLNWREGTTRSIDERIAGIGEPWGLLYELDTGLSPEDQSALADTLGMTEEAPQNFMISAYRELLEEHGPLWLTTGIVISSHVRLLVGYAGDGSDERTTFELIDPAKGARITMPASEFVRAYEQEARLMVDLGVHKPLRQQVLHW